jgi:hypothetical protein
VSKDKFVGSADDFQFPWVRPAGDEEADHGAMLELAEMLAGGKINREQYDSACARLAGKEELSLAGMEWLAEARQVGEVWQGESGRWFTKNREGHVVPSAAPGGGAGSPAAAAVAGQDPAGRAGGAAGADSAGGGALPRAFGRAGVKVRYGLAGEGLMSRVPARLRSFFKGTGRPAPSPDDLADMAGVLPASRNVEAKPVVGEKGPGKGRLEILITADHDDLGAQLKRRVGQDADGKVYVYNDFIKVAEHRQKAGIGTEVFGRGVENAKRLGASYIACHAARAAFPGQKEFNGYVTWPKMGYDEPLESIERYNPAGAAKIKEAFPDALSIQDVMEAEGGAEWWAANGFDLHNAQFDLSDNSRSMVKFAKYLEDSAARRAAKQAGGQQSTEKLSMDQPVMTDETFGPDELESLDAAHAAHVRELAELKARDPEAWQRRRDEHHDRLAEMFAHLPNSGDPRPDQGNDPAAG